jgi:hypothetical protein
LTFQEPTKIVSRFNLGGIDDCGLSAIGKRDWLLLAERIDEALDAGFAESSDIGCSVKISKDLLIRVTVTSDLVATTVEWLRIRVS